MSNYEQLSQEFNAMLQRGKIPCFEIELKDSEYLLVDLSISTRGLEFIFDTDDMKTWFSGNVQKANTCCFYLPIELLDSGLDEALEWAYAEILEGFICPNNLFPESE